KFNFTWLVVIILSLLIFLGIREYMFFICLFLIPASFLPLSGKDAGVLFVKLILVFVLLGQISSYMGFGFLGKDYIASSHYFNLDYINSSRIAIGDHGSGAFFADPSSALWGKDLWSNIKAAATGIFFFFVSINITKIGSFRQLIALPEVLLVLLLLPALFRGMVNSWRYLRYETLPLFVFSFGILAVYGSVSTNMGAMFRWRMQAMPFFLAFLAYGLLLQKKGFFYRILTHRFKI
ncbi:MAG: hypothetical protein D3923_04710, partial [Candidatus Electrothrix sp. AR3]|nr:hypothetical protein [Candidatus Electrothrix sp. AR3]